MEANEESLNRRTIESAIMRAVFPDDRERRGFRGRRPLDRHGRPVQLLPPRRLEAMAQEKGPWKRRT
jgi:hypothetical protein